MNDLILNIVIGMVFGAATWGMIKSTRKQNAEFEENLKHLMQLNSENAVLQAAMEQHKRVMEKALLDQREGRITIGELKKINMKANEDFALMTGQPSAPEESKQQEPA